MRDWEELARAREQIRVDWSADQSRAVEEALPRLRRRRAVRRATVGSLVLLVVAGAVTARLMVRHAPVIAAATAVAPVIAASPVVTDSTTPLSPETQLRALPGDATFELVRGRARFVVASRPLRVECGAIAVESSAGELVVERRVDGVHVAVTRGSARVIYAGHRVELAEGQAQLFLYDTAPLPVPAVQKPVVHKTPEPPSWKALAEQGDFDGAYAALQKRTLHDDPAELLAAADVARLSHHPREAAAPLRRVLRDHAADARAPLAAFTLGRILLEDLGQPAEAAAAFATAQREAAEGVLAPDALAREVEAWSRAGETEKARARAEEYVRRFPTGTRLRSVRKYGGLE